MKTTGTSRIRTQWPWLAGYKTREFADDSVAAIIITVLLVPQSLAYALLAGLPPQVGIYAAILPPVAYALFGSSRHLSVGPTAVVSLMTAAGIAALPEEMRVPAAAALALMTGVMLMILGLLRAGFIMNFVSRPVVSSYITGAALLIIISQMKHVFGVTSSGNTAIDILQSFWGNMDLANPVAFSFGIGTLIFLFLSKKYLAYGLFRLGVKKTPARLLARFAPVIAVIICIVISAGLNLADHSALRTVGNIPNSLPPLALPALGLSDFQDLFIPATVIALVAFVDSMTITQTLASRARNRIDANKELLGLGASNFVAGVSGAYPVNGSLSRSAVNYTAGAKTPVSGVIVAGLMALTAMFLTPVLKALPLATLASLIIFACFSLLDFKSLWRTWVYSRADGVTALATFFSVLIFGVQWGVLIGVILSMGLHIRLTLQPHMVLVGRFPGTEHYRDADRFNVETNEIVKTLRIDESLYYANARYLEDIVARIVADSPEMTDLILMCPAVNRIDASALSSLEEINKRLLSAGIRLHFSELHSHVKDRLHRSNFLENLSGRIFLSQHEAMSELEPEPDWSQFSDHIDMH